VISLPVAVPKDKPRCWRVLSSRTARRVTETLLCWKISTDLDMTFTSKLTMNNALPEQIGQRIHDISRDALNGAHSLS